MINLLNKIYFSLLLFSSGISVFGQDIHFSQFFSSPLNLSPSETGSFKGDYRFAGNQRSQWRSITNPYTFNTFGGSFDQNGVFNRKYLNSGISLYNDNGGDSDFNTLQLTISGSINKIISSDSSHSLSLGIQSGFTQRKINYNKLRFDNQYNGTSFDPNSSNGESFPISNLGYPNLNAGLSWSFEPSINKAFKAGFAVHNINKPKQSLFNNSEIKLDRRISIYSTGAFWLNNNWIVLPGILNMFQGKYREHVIGSNVKMILNSDRRTFRALTAGAWIRTRDAGYLLVGLDYNNFNVGMSYDFTFSELNPASNYKGGLEVSVIYIISKFVPSRIRYRVCPSFV